MMKSPRDLVRWLRNGRLAGADSTGAAAHVTDSIRAPDLDRAGVLLESGRGIEAMTLLGDALWEASPPPEVSALYARWLVSCGRSIEGLREFRAGARASRSAALDLEFASVLSTAGEHDEAYAIASAVALAMPDHFEAVAAAARYAAAAGHRTVARKLFEHALYLSPDEPAVFAGYARTLAACGEDAVALRMAVEFSERHPDNMEVVSAIAHIQNRLGLDLAMLVSLEQVIALAKSTAGGVPSSLVYLYALKLSEVGRLRESAIALIEQIRIDPDIQLHVQLNFALFGLGCFRDGWRRYSIRWFTESLAGRRSHPELVRWGGDEPAGASIVVGHEAGIGDLIMMARFIPTLRSRGADTILVVPTELVPLASRFTGVGRVVPSGQPVEGGGRFDRFVSLGDLPGRLGVDVESVGGEEPYLSVDPSKRAWWAKRLGDAKVPKVGLVWAGNPGHVRDAERSIPFKKLAPILSLASVRFFSLQKGSQDIASSESANTAVEDLAPHLDDFTDTCAALEQLDLLITVDTSVAHAAGALGVPTWLLVAMPPDYRWLNEGDSTYWYPSVRLYRQSQYRDWEPVIARVASDLRDWLACSQPEVRSQLLRAKDEVTEPSSLALDGVPDVVETRFGVLQVPATGDLECESLRRLGEYVAVFRDRVLEMAQPGQTVLQVGAGVGELSLGLADRLGPEGHLLAFESNVEKATILRHNIRGNRASNVTVQRADLDLGVPAGSIDGLFVRALHGVVLWGRLDIARFANGATRTFWASRPWAMVLCDTHAESVERARALSGFGYRCWSMAMPMFRMANYLGRRSDDFAGMERFAILAVAEEVPYTPMNSGWRTLIPEL